MADNPTARVQGLSDDDGDFAVVDSSDSDEEGQGRDLPTGVPEPRTKTWTEQAECEKKITSFYEYYKIMLEQSSIDKAILTRASHVKFLRGGLQSLPQSYASLDASRPWIVYWIVHALELLDSLPEAEELSNVVHFLGKCQNPTGGFGGGPGQLSHLAPTYAAVNALAIIGTEEAFNLVNRETLYRWLLTLKDASGCFRMHQDGETDVRANYCALSAATLVNIVTPELTVGVAEFIRRCQTYEGGFGGEPGNEAHGGYAFCAFAALVLLNRTDIVDLPSLLSWAVQRQMVVEGGFQGRTNKLVDGCYSFWQGGLFPLLDWATVNPSLYAPGAPPATHESAQVNLESLMDEGGWLFDQAGLAKYILLCGQDPKGGLRDKPGKWSDYYHSCYCLSGLSVAQHNPLWYPTPLRMFGTPDSLVMPTDPTHNIGPGAVRKAKDYFKSKPRPGH